MKREIREELEYNQEKGKKILQNKNVKNAMVAGGIAAGVGTASYFGVKYFNKLKQEKFPNQSVFNYLSDKEPFTTFSEYFKKYSVRFKKQAA